MNAIEIVNQIMTEKEIKQADMASALDITPAALWDRLKPSKDNISIKKLSEMLRYLNYEVVIMPRGKASHLDDVYVVGRQTK